MGRKQVVDFYFGGWYKDGMETMCRALAVDAIDWLIDNARSYYEVVSLAREDSGRYVISPDNTIIHDKEELYRADIFGHFNHEYTNPAFDSIYDIHTVIAGNKKFQGVTVADIADFLDEKRLDKIYKELIKADPAYDLYPKCFLEPYEISVSSVRSIMNALEVLYQRNAYALENEGEEKFVGLFDEFGAIIDKDRNRVEGPHGIYAPHLEVMKVPDYAELLGEESYIPTYAKIRGFKQAEAISKFFSNPEYYIKLLIPDQYKELMPRFERRADRFGFYIPEPYKKDVPFVYSLNYIEQGIAKFLFDKEEPEKDYTEKTNEPQILEEKEPEKEKPEINPDGTRSVYVKEWGGAVYNLKELKLEDIVEMMEDGSDYNRITIPEVIQDNINKVRRKSAMSVAQYVADRIRYDTGYDLTDKGDVMDGFIVPAAKNAVDTLLDIKNKSTDTVEIRIPDYWSKKYLDNKFCSVAIERKGLLKIQENNKPRFLAVEEER